MAHYVFDECGVQIGLLRGKVLFGPGETVLGFVDARLNIYDCRGSWTGKHLRKTN